MRTAAIVKRVLIAVAGLVGLIVAAIIGLLWFGPVAISDKGMLLNVVLGRSVDAPSADAIRTQLRVPQGFKIELFAAELSGARMLQTTSRGDLLVSIPRSGQIVWLAADRNGDGVSDDRHILVDQLNRPHGLDLHDGWLYVGEHDAVGRIKLDESQSKTEGAYQRIVPGLSAEGNHWSKTVRVGPDGFLYLAQGSTCNVCVEADPRRAAIMRFRLDGLDGQIIATGLRNSVGLDWSPWDKVLYATENGRDLLGDDAPNEELNLIVPGGFYGWPYVHAFGIVDPEFGTDQGERIAQSIAPAHGFRAHNAPLGLRFLTHAPAGYERSALVALHGSWNRSTPDGYKVVSLHWDANGKIDEREFLTGFVTDKGIIGRPVDIAESADAIYISDDYAGVIYRVTKN